MFNRDSRRASGAAAAAALAASIAMAAVLLSGGCASTPEDAAATTVAEPPSTPAPTLEERWGVEIVGLRLTAANYMLDFRYKVLDPDKAAPLFYRANKPKLIHRGSGAELEVPRPAKTGPLRPTNPPEAGRTYFMFFANPGVVQAGDEVTITIGDFEADVVVE
jgi:hypothetical protein